MLDTYSELGRSTPEEISATRGGPLTMRGLTPQLPTGNRGTCLKPPNALEVHVLIVKMCFLILIIADAIILHIVFCDMWRTEECFKRNYYAT